MNPVIPIGIGTVLLLILILFAAGAFYLCKPRGESDAEDLEAREEAEWQRRKLLAQSEIMRDGSHR